MRIDSVRFFIKGQKRVGVRFAPDAIKSKRPAVLMLHGFPGAEKNTDIARELTKRGWICWLPNFCGSWGSRGFYSFSGILQDTHENWKRMRRDPDIHNNKMAVLGFSFGGWAALNFAAKNKQARAVVALAPMAGAGMWFNPGAREKVIRLGDILDIRSGPDLWRSFKSVLSRNNPLDNAHRIAPMPLLLAHGTKDELVPYALGQRLYKNALPPKRFVTIPGADHCFSEHRAPLVKKVVSWLTQTVA